MTKVTDPFAASPQMAPVAWMPSSTGMRMSMSTTSGRSSAVRATACWP